MKIEKFFNKKEKKELYRTRFELGGKQFRPVADTRRKLLDMIDEIRAQEHRSKFDLPVKTTSPLLKTLFAKHLARIKKPHQKKLFERVSEYFLRITGEDIKIHELKKAHFQTYIDERLSQTGVQSKLPIKPQTVRRELTTIGAALDNASLFFSQLEDYRKPTIPKPKTIRGKRERMVSNENEIEVLLGELRRRVDIQSDDQYFHRRRLADFIEFGLLTGLRRKEISTLKKSQFDEKERFLRNVQRHKTDSVTKIYPLTRRAAEILAERILINKGEYIFTPNGKPIESSYRTLKKICEDKGINYGKYKDDGFVLHDLRHNFATEIIKHADPETAREFLGHASLDQLGTYLHTDTQKMRAAISRSEKVDKLPELVEIYKGVKRGKIRIKGFIERFRNLSEF